jgi:hypothetical protein
MHQLTATEVAVLKAVFFRDIKTGYEAIPVREIDPFSVSVSVGTLYELGLIDAMRTPPSQGLPGVWLPGNVTPRGAEWLEVYGLKR